MFKSVPLRGFNAYDADAVSRETGLSIDPDESVVQQQFAEECDINTIVKRFGLTGELPNGVDMPLSGDFTGVSDFQTAMNLIRQSQESFLELPADVRERFSNDPAMVIRFLDDPKNREEAIKLGIVAKPVERTRDVVQAVDELASVLKPKA
nr:MAG: internal scaffolding protein [Microvirus sp.]